MLFRLLGCVSLLLLIQSCKNTSQADHVNFSTLRGKTMGTTYSIIFKDANEEATQFKEGIDSVLFALNMEVSTYIPGSVISRINKNDSLSINVLELVDGDTLLCTHFINNFSIAKELYEETEGMLDPTVMPLVNYWGFGYSGREVVENVDSAEVQRLVDLVDFSKVKLNGFDLIKESIETKLDFSSVAKGYGVDLVGQYLERKGINDYLIEIGGEMLGSGKNRESDSWKVGINTPVAGASQGDYEVIVALEEGAIATSGNYRIFYENEEGERFAHIINPRTGFSELSRLLSVSVFAKTCAEADGLATGFMTMGLDAAVVAVEELEDVDACFIFVNEKGELEVEYSKGLKENILLDKTKS